MLRAAGLSARASLAGRPRARACGARAGLAALLVLSGCGKPGRPLPPLPRGPFPPTEVDVRQLGEAASVSFVVPRPRGPAPGQEQVRAELLRVTHAPGLPPSTAPDAFWRRGELVEVRVADPFSPGERVRLVDDSVAELPGGVAGWTIRYAVRVRDRRGRSSPLVVLATLELLAAAGAPRSLAAEPTAEGVRLDWEAPLDRPDATSRVYRRSPGKPWPEEPLTAEPLTGATYLDTSVTTGESYEYEVRVVLAPGRPWREGPPSEVVGVVAEDRFAPAAPEGLVAVQEGQAVRLFWNPSPERDVAGYRIERRAADEPWATLGPTPVEQPSWVDHAVEIGRRYAYRVVAIDRATPPNASEPSRSVEIELRQEPDAEPQPASERSDEARLSPAAARRAAAGVTP